MLDLHRGKSRDLRSLEVAPNLWSGVGLVRGGAGTALVGLARGGLRADQRVRRPRHRPLHPLRLPAPRGGVAVRRGRRTHPRAARPDHPRLPDDDFMGVPFATSSRTLTEPSVAARGMMQVWTPNWPRPKVTRDPPSGQCWCCGSIDDPDRMVHLGNHPEVMMCRPCARWAAKEAWEIEDRDKTLVLRIRGLVTRSGPSDEAPWTEVGTGTACSADRCDRSASACPSPRTSRDADGPV